MTGLRGSTAALRIAVAVLCAFAIRWSCTLIRADLLFRQDTPQSVARAIELTPDQARYYVRLSQLDDTHAVALLETALRLAPFNPSAAIELGLRAESAGDHGRAERLLLAAFEVDRTYLPRWTLANFYFRRHNLPAFWSWARRAAEMPADDIRALFELCWRVNPDGENVARAILSGDPSSRRQYLTFLLGKNETRAAGAVASQLIERGNPLTDRALLLSLVDGLISGNDPVAASALWRSLTDRQWIVADRAVPNNANFARQPIPVAFDWRFAPADGLNTSPGPSGLAIEFSGKQPEICLIAEQVVLLSAGLYEFVSSYRTGGLPAETGLSWTFIDVGSGAPLAQLPAPSTETFAEKKTRFSVKRQNSLVHLQLGYHRALGTPRISGTLVVRSAIVRTVTADEVPKMR